jgi:YidC/Oxa1 family membrane protein insertase
MATAPSFLDRDKLTGILILGLMFSVYFLVIAPKEAKNRAARPALPTGVVARTDTSQMRAAGTGDLAALAPEPGAPAEAVMPAEAAAAPPPGAAPRLVCLSNALATYTFTDFGGDIYKIELARAPMVRKGPLTTAFAPSNAWEMPLRLCSTAGFDPARTIFGVEHQQAHVLAFTGMVNHTLFLRKTYALTNGYLLQADLAFSNVTRRALALSNVFWLGRIALVPGVDARKDLRGCDLEVLREGAPRILRIGADKKDVATTHPGPAVWLAVRNKYFANVLVPETPFVHVETRSLGAPTAREVTAWAAAAPLLIAPRAAQHWHATLYAGPKAYNLLQTLPAEIGRGTYYLELLNLGKFAFLAKPILLYGLKGLYRYTHNYGWAIIIVTIIIKLLTWPLQTKSYVSMQRMQKVQPELKLLQEKFKGDPRQLQQEQMLLYRKHGVNPMGGCLPIALQIPIFFALYSALDNAVELWGASFWYIKDLTMPDSVYTLSFSIPFLGNAVNPLPLLMTAATIIQQVLTPHTGDKSQKQMMLMMPVVFLAIFYNMPSGLVLYWFVNQLLSAVQTLMLHYYKKA